GLIFNVGPLDDGTNNIGEFLAIVHALAWMQQNSLNLTICSDSRNAISWVAQKKCKTKLEPTSRNSKVFELIARAERWLNENPFRTKIVKWETKLWGEIPADFGRK
ncbi:MAG: ribonuclease H, partial [Bacteroidales bacterium]